ncbi:MAG: hemolysin III family protein [Candidatus Odyssella sp.]|nr:hemolysin III family protein [Candidatus Odyssella sp.]
MRSALAALVRRARDDHDDLGSESFAEEVANAVTHAIGAGLAITALVLGVVYAAQIESAWAIVAAAIYGATLVFMFLVSTLYHSIPHLGAKRLFLACDHIAIFLLIAGTYTAITLAVMNGTWQGWVMFGVIWGLALTGIVLRVVWLRYMHPIFYVIYLAMGWLGFLFADAVEAKVGWAGVEMILIGGVCYTGGMVFYALRKLPFNHALWHGAVLAGAIVHFFAVYDYIIPRAA